MRHRTVEAMRRLWRGLSCSRVERVHGNKSREHADEFPGPGGRAGPEVRRYPGWVGQPSRDPGASELREREGWEQFVRASYPAIWRFCAALAGRGSADDLAQETFLRATRALPSFMARATGRTWILAIARRVCMDELRGRYRRDRRDRDLARAASPTSASGDHADDLAVRDLLRHLNPDRRVAFVLTQLFQLSYAEAAEVCECPVGTIRSRVARARDDLIELLGTESPVRPRHAAERPHGC